MINRALYETLLTYKGGDASTPVPAIASKWKVNAGATEFTFTIDPKAKFADGTKVTSADVVFSLNRLKNVKGNPSSLMNGITAAAPNASTVVLTTEKATPQVLAIVTSPALGILNSKVAKLTVHPMLQMLQQPIRHLNPQVQSQLVADHTY
jgi:ABC-type dipeptide transport system, periplasmic component